MSRSIRFGRIVSLATGKASGEEFSIGLEAVQSGTGRLVANPITDYDGGGIAFRSGDVLFGKLRPYLAKVWLADRNGSAVGDFHVYRARSETVPEYLKWVLLANNFLDPVISSVFGAKMPRANWNFIRDVEVYLPSIPTQRGIAHFLERETAEIESLIEAQQNLIDLLLERRLATIDREFSTVEPNSRIARACKDVVDCPHTTPDVDDDGEFEAVRTASVRDGRFRPNRGLRVSETTWRRRNVGGAPSMGDVLFAREGGSAGEAAMVPSESICLGQRMVLLRIDADRALGEFILWQIYCRRVQDYFRLAISGAAAGNIRLPALRNTPVWLPDLAEQRRIAAHLHVETSKIDSLIADAERFIELSRERRSALITAAVTGQINVQDEVA